MKITQLRCDINKKKYNFIDIVHIKICMSLIHDLDYVFSTNPVISINITLNVLKIVAAPIKLSVSL